MRSYKIVNKEEIPTIPINKVTFNDGFIIVTSAEEAIGIIVEDIGQEEYLFITQFNDYFTSDFTPYSSNPNLKNLMETIKSEYTDPVEFNFIKIEE